MGIVLKYFDRIELFFWMLGSDRIGSRNFSLDRSGSKQFFDRIGSSFFFEMPRSDRIGSRFQNGWIEKLYIYIYLFIYLFIRSR